VGLLAGLMTAAEITGQPWTSPPQTTALGALLAHITGDAEADSYQPMNINFGLFPTLDEVKKKQRKAAYTERAKADLAGWQRTTCLTG
jgi:methylenetetrahydrofolate--tRNA-(uracil-5-)-methyltransferase